MAIKGISFAEKHWFCSNKDPDAKPTLEESREAGATIFWWGAIPNVIMTQIADRVTSSSVSVGDMMTQTFNQRTANRNRDAFRYGIRSPGFENFYDDAGEPIVPTWINVMEGGQAYQVLSEDTMNQVSLQVIQEIGAHIFNSNSLGEEGRKKLEAALSPSEGLEAFSAIHATALPNENEDANGAQSSTEQGQKKTKNRTFTGRTQSPKKSKTGAQDD